MDIYKYSDGILLSYWIEYQNGISNYTFSEILNKFFKNEWKKYQTIKFNSDRELVEYLRDNIKQKIYTDNKIGKIRSDKRINDLKNIFKTNFVELNSKNTLDFGSGDSKISAHIADVFKVNMYATDKKEWITEQITPTEDNIKFEYIKDGCIPFDVNFDMIMSFMVLHHITDDELNNVITDFTKHINDKGYLLLREHDAYNKYYIDMCHIEHLMYSIIYDNIQWDDFINNYVGNYKSIQNWIDILTKSYFKCIYTYKSHGVTNYTYALFKYDKFVYKITK